MSKITTVAIQLIGIFEVPLKTGNKEVAVEIGWALSASEVVKAGKLKEVATDNVEVKHG